MNFTINLVNEGWIRLFCFSAILIIIALYEYITPRRNFKINKTTRWFRNLSIITINVIILRLLLPFTPSTVAIFAEQQQFGLLNNVHFPFVVTIIISIFLLDLLIYTQHVVFHHIPLFWQIHKIHHIDQEVDTTTGLRFHPIEIILSALLKSLAILLFGTPLIAVVLFEIILNATSMFSHANLKIPLRLDKLLRLIIITPDMHRVHHSIIVKETNSNFGFNLSLWDRLFRTYKAQPQKGHLKMDIGLKEYPDLTKTGLLNIMSLDRINSTKK